MNRLTLPTRLETERLVLERLRYEDAEEIFYTYASKAEVTRFLSWPTHRSIDDTRAFLRHAITAWEKGKDFSYSLRLKDSRRLIGSFGLLHDEGVIQFGYALSPNWWGRGYATEACGAVMNLLLKTNNVHRVNTFVDSENKASIRVLEKSGLVREGRLLKWFTFVNQGNESRDCELFYLPLKRSTVVNSGNASAMS